MSSPTADQTLPCDSPGERIGQPSAVVEPAPGPGPYGGSRVLLCPAGRRGDESIIPSRTTIAAMDGCTADGSREEGVLGHEPHHAVISMNRNGCTMPYRGNTLIELRPRGTRLQQ